MSTPRRLQEWRHGEQSAKRRGPTATIDGRDKGQAPGQQTTSGTQTKDKNDDH
jgi:hypothetical protein